MLDGYTYHGFISYAHADESVASKLHNALETFSVPKKLRGTFGKRISPIFRDTSELNAHHSLSDKIRQAVQSSRFLIVLCSPASKKSHWVNEEIRLFREIHGEASILCALIEGTPATSFPPALLEGGREPIAANLSSQNFRHGVSQISASILGVGLDDIIQRELKRYRRRVTGVMAGALIAMLLMGSLTWTALEARKDAEQRREDAEGQIEFMLTDLKDELAAVGRQSAMKIVADRAANYYDSYPVSKHDDEALIRRAQVFHYLGEIQQNLGNPSDAKTAFEQAFELTKALTVENPQNVEAVYVHGHSAFWLGALYYETDNYQPAIDAFAQYLSSAKAYRDLTGDNDTALLELAYAFSSLGNTYLETGNLTAAKENLIKSIEYKELLAARAPEDFDRVISVANGYASLAAELYRRGRVSEVIEPARIAYTTVKTYALASENDAVWLYEVLSHAPTLCLSMMFNNAMGETRQCLQEGRRLSAKLLQIDPDNVDYRYKSIQLDLMFFDLSYLESDLSTATALQDEITEKLDGFPEGFKETSRYEYLESLKNNIPLLLAIGAQNQAVIRQEARRLDAYLVAKGMTSAQKLADAPYHLYGVILLDLTLDAQQWRQILNEICEHDPASFNVAQRHELASYLKPKNCVDGGVETFVSGSVITAAIKKLK